jgi:hypothetical protein
MSHNKNFYKLLSNQVQRKGLTFLFLSADIKIAYEVKVLFLYSDNHKCRLDLRGGNLPKALPHTHPGVRTAFYFRVKGGEKDEG